MAQSTELFVPTTFDTNSRSELDTMESTKLTISALKSLAPYICILQAYSRRNYRCARENLPKKLCLLLGVLILSTAVITVAVILNRDLFEHDSSALLRDISTNLTIAQIAWTHIACVFNNQRIIQVIACLGGTVTSREIYFIHEASFLKIYLIYLLITSN